MVGTLDWREGIFKIEKEGFKRFLKIVGKADMLEDLLKQLYMSYCKVLEIEGGDTIYDGFGL